MPVDSGGQALIEFEGVTKVFPGGTVAVDDISLVAPAGRITVVMGPRGCGKTSLLRMVNRMLDPSAGRVLISDAPNTNVRRSQLRRGMGYLAAGGLFPHRTVARNIETVPLLMGVDRGAARDRAMALLEHVGLPTSFADKYPGQLSKGQQIRVGLARALAADPPVLLLDAPFTALEPSVRQDIQDDLLELQRIAPKTILLATEDIDEAIKLGDQIAVLDTGRLVQLATPQTLLAYPGSDYVADLLGRDRGIRKLTFLPAGDLPLVPAATVQAGTTGSRAQAIADSYRERWLLVLDPDRRPRGWVDSAVLGPDQIVSGPVVHPLGGTFYADESVLAALDAAILSPPGLAVCLDDEGKTLGVVSHTEIARYLSAQPPLPSGARPATMSAFDQAMAEPAQFEAPPRPARGFGDAGRSAAELAEMAREEAASAEAALAEAARAEAAKAEAVKAAAAKAEADAAKAEAARVEAEKAEAAAKAEAAELEAAKAETAKVEAAKAEAARAEAAKLEAAKLEAEKAQVAKAEAERAAAARADLDATAAIPAVTEPPGPSGAPAADVQPDRGRTEEPPTAPMPQVTPVRRSTTPAPVPVIKETARQTPPTVRPANGNRGAQVPAPSERRNEPAVEAEPVQAAAAETTEAKPESARRSSVAGGWEWRSDLGQWVQVEPDAAGATAGDGSAR